MTTITAADLDEAYTHLCRTMTRIGEDKAMLFLARLAMLALTLTRDAEAARRLVDAAAADIEGPDAAPSID